MKAMIFAAGLGTRFKPWTDHHPKALALVNGKSLLQRNIEYLQTFGFNEVIVNVHHFADQIEEAIQKNNGWGSSIFISDERDEVLETGGGLLKAKPFLENEAVFLTMNADILTNLDLNKMLIAHRQKNALITLAVMVRDSSRQLLFDENSQLRGWRNRSTGEERGEIVQNPDKKNLARELAFSGIAVYDSRFFEEINRTGKFSLTDAYLELAKNHRIVAFDHTGDILMDVGSEDKLKKAERIIT